VRNRLSGVSYSPTSAVNFARAYRGNRSSKQSEIEGTGKSESAPFFLSRRS
jgi:hypothetical protein